MKKYMPILILFIFIVYYSYMFGYYSEFQKDSEGLVVSRIVAGMNHMDISLNQYGLGGIHNENIDDIMQSPYLFYSNPDLLDENIVFTDYKSQIGLHGYIFYHLSKFVPEPLRAIKLGVTILWALIFLLICRELNKKYGLIMAGSFYITAIMSSWINNFASNLYWLAFTWFAPMLLGLLLLNNINSRKTLLIYPLFFVAIFIKSACGYEFITTIMLSSIMFILFEFIINFKTNKKYSYKLLRSIFAIGFISLLGFFSALCIHSYMRGSGDILMGLYNIFETDVMRRTYGVSENFTSHYADSLNASVFIVLAKYIFSIKSLDVLLLMSGTIFVLYKSYKQNLKDVFSDIILFLISFVTSASWFVLAKAHSYDHTHINYIMWYMAFAPMCLYIILKFFIPYFSCSKLWLLLKSTSDKSSNGEVN